METKEYRLTEICEFQGGTQPPKQEWVNEPRDGFVRMLQIRDFTQGKEEHIAYVKDTKKLNKCEEDDILIGRYGASVGKILTGLAGAYNVAIIKTIPNEELLSKRYLYYVLTGTNFQNFITTIGARAAQAGFNKNDLSFFKLHLPSLAIQESIAEILTKADSIIEKREHSLNLLESYTENLFYQFFGNPLTNDNGYERKTLKDICNKITDGTHHSPPIEDTGIPYITAKHVKPFIVDFWSKPWYISKENHDDIFKRCDPAKGDILYIKDGATTGIAAINKYDFEFSMLSSLALLKPNKSICNSEFICYWLNNSLVKSEILKLMAGGAIQRLTLTKINQIALFLPPIELQEQFATIVNQIDILRESQVAHLNWSVDLKNSLIQKALKGELELVQKVYVESTIKVQPKISGEVIAIDKINKELEKFHKSQPHTGAPDEIDNTIRQLEAELKIKGEIPFWDEYLKYRIVKGKFKEPFTFDQLWEEITKFPFETVPEYDEVATLLFKWLSEENAFIRQQFNESTKQIELIVNETAKA